MTILSGSMVRSGSSGSATLGPLDPIITADVDKEYEVEHILKHHRWGQVMEYLVHWHSYNEAEDSWVLEQDLIHAHQIF